MENASKALLIAASVLVAILLIAFAVKTINSTSGINESQQETMQTAEMAQFNSKFTQYSGSGKSAAQVKALANVVIANNATNPSHFVFIIFNGRDRTYNSNRILQWAAEFYEGKKCKITCETDDSGWVKNIKIDEES